MSELDEVVVEERNPVFEAMGHAQLVLDDEQAVQEGARLEVQRVVDVLLGRAGHVAIGQLSAKDRDGVDVAQLAPHRWSEEAGTHFVGYQAAPEGVVLRDVVVDVLIDDGAVVAPGVPGKQLVAARTGQDHLDESAREAGKIVVGVGLPDPGVLEVPGEGGQAAHHVAGL